MNVVNLEWY